MNPELRKKTGIAQSLHNFTNASFDLRYLLRKLGDPREQLFHELISQRLISME